MKKSEIKQLAGFYENEHVNKFLAFWLPRCVDSECGGFVNCFDNRGEKLVSHDKYVWSQGRFVWVFSKLASTTAPIFSAAQKAEFLALAKHGVDFLMEHCLMGEDDWRCIFLLDREGNPKYVDGCDRLDMSVYADCFVVAGLSKYASVTGDEKVYAFAKKLFKSITDRIVANDFQRNILDLGCIRKRFADFFGQYAERYILMGHFTAFVQLRQTNYIIN